MDPGDVLDLMLDYYAENHKDDPLSNQAVREIAHNLERVQMEESGKRQRALVLQRAHSQRRLEALRAGFLWDPREKVNVVYPPELLDRAIKAEVRFIAKCNEDIKELAESEP